MERENGGGWWEDKREGLGGRDVWRQGQKKGEGMGRSGIGSDGEREKVGRHGRSVTGGMKREWGEGGMLGGTERRTLERREWYGEKNGKTMER